MKESTSSLQAESHSAQIKNPKYSAPAYSSKLKALPAHLRRYQVEQDYSRYTPVDQAVWRYVMRQLSDFLSRSAHPCYLDGLRQTGISTEKIPDLTEVSSKLEKFGWRVIPVSGFIPPAAFMELQAHGFLPVACDMRSIDHIAYTPAPDIVHEAAGHAPILIDPEFAAYLKSYAEVASHAIISHEDIAQYDAIRVLSDLKEAPDASLAEIARAEQELARVSKGLSHISEAALLGRMNWWTAEYGLIGTVEEPRIYGAGLLSSLGEARECLSEKVKKIPISLDCINYAYDITEPQPQLFVTPDFQHLRVVLEQFAATMAFRVGGLPSLQKALIAETVNTVTLDSGLQISGQLKSMLTDVAKTKPIYLQFSGPTQLCQKGFEIPQQGVAHHALGFGSPLGRVITSLGSPRSLVKLRDEELKQEFAITPGIRATLRFESGVEVSGRVTNLLRAPGGDLQILVWEDCTAVYEGTKLFSPEWGTYDMAVGAEVISVSGGPADRSAFGETSDFIARVIPRRHWSVAESKKHALYQKVRDFREGLRGAPEPTFAAALTQLEKLETEVSIALPNEWLLTLEIYELGASLRSVFSKAENQSPNPSDTETAASSWLSSIKDRLTRLGEADAATQARIVEALQLLPLQL